MTAPTLRGQRVVLRPIEDGDRSILAAILAEPEVVRWWDGTPPDRAAADWTGDPDATCLVIELDGTVVGSVLASEEEDPGYRHGGLDIFLTTRVHGQGLGRDELRTAARWLFEERGHHRLTIDPSAGNERAIRCYAGIGFRPVGIMRAYERGPDGTFHDGLLMDLLRDELR